MRLVVCRAREHRLLAQFERVILDGATVAFRNEPLTPSVDRKQEDVSRGSSNSSIA